MKNPVTQSLISTLKSNAKTKISDNDIKYLSIYYHRLSGQDFESSKACEFKAEAFKNVALFHRKLGNKRKPDETIIAIRNQEFNKNRHKLEAKQSVVFIILQDQPFVIDSLLIKLNSLHKTPLRILHPLFAVVRDKTNKALSYQRAIDVTEDAADSAAYLFESHIQFAIQHTAESDHQELITQLHKVINDVTTVTTDWLAMKSHVGRLAKIVENSKGKPIFSEYSEFFNWITEDHFTFLGYCELALSGEQKSRKVQLDQSSTLGVLQIALEDEIDPVSEILPPIEFMETSPLVFTKTRARANIHRSKYMDCILLNQDFGSHKPTRKVHCIVGFLASSTAVLSTSSIPHIGRKSRYVLETSTLRYGGYAYKELRSILETLPRDKLLQMDMNSLYSLCMTLLNQQNRKTRLHIHRNVCGHFYSCLVYIPKELFNSQLRLKIQAYLAQALDASETEFDVYFSESILTRIHFTIHTRNATDDKIDPIALEKAIQDISHDWNEKLFEALCAMQDADHATQSMNLFRDAFSVSYQQDFSIKDALKDIEIFSKTSEHTIQTRLHLGKKDDESGKIIATRASFKIYTCNTSPILSDVIPILENMGIRIHSGRPYQVKSTDGKILFVLDFEISRLDKEEFNAEQSTNEFEQTFVHCWSGDIENDGYNQLTLLSGISWRRISMIRAYYRYLKQIRLRYSENYIIDALVKNPRLISAISQLFGATYDPRRKKIGIRKLKNQVNDLLKKVSTLDETRIIRAFLDVMDATLRTNYFQPYDNGEPKSYISMKIRSRDIPRIPQPAPLYEIFVYSPAVEGVHLRGGKVARGGLRWSDRPEDFRTEVLGLVKAQRVKNAVIVPVGSKGGFVAKRLSVLNPAAHPGAAQQEVIQCYKTFISALLDITDNIVEGQVIAPKNVLRMDQNDPYLVVAADKGTATFSDIANGISEDYGFWLGDAFASGGSAGYDHKKMGITARGAWESVKRHFRELGKDIQSEPFTVVGIGDMAGDVFGNGMLLSKQIKLLAAFNHKHIFIDPNPDPQSSYKERQRLFQMPASSWADYNTALISKGGGVFERSAKSINLSAQIKKILGAKQNQYTPTQLINLMLKSDIELLWNGGIGTYVKASGETHADAQDKNNDALRVDANELHCRVIGEGGNLGLTQLARIEYCQQGGLCYSDAIDNSAGVDTSDHEVNIKIILNSAIQSGKLTTERRNNLLVKMEKDVGKLVLANNYLQTQVISLEANQGLALMSAQTHTIELLEASGLLNRKIEFLPDSRELKEMMDHHSSLTRAEISVLLSYSKMDLYQKLLNSRLPDEPYLESEIIEYFPPLMSASYDQEIRQHSLKREIISTQITNNLVGTMGTTFTPRMEALTGNVAEDIAAAYICARDILDSRTLMAEIQALDNRVATDIQMSAITSVVECLESLCLWIVRNSLHSFNISELFNRYAHQFKSLQENIETIMQSVEESVGESVGESVAADEYAQKIEQYIAQGLPKKIAAKLVRTTALIYGLDIIDIAETTKRPLALTATVYFSIAKRLNINWIYQQIKDLPRENIWHDRCRFSLTANLREHKSALTRAIINQSTSTSYAKLLAEWLENNTHSMQTYDKLFHSLSHERKLDISMLSVMVDEINRLI